MKRDFTKPLSKSQLNLDEKKRSNLLAWRGQFSPELIENILKAYANENDVLLDPFCGSGTLLYEAGRLGFPAVGVELNPAAYNLSKTYELININLKNRQKVMADFYARIETAFELPQLFDPDDPIVFSKSDIVSILTEVARGRSGELDEILANCLITVLDFNGTEVSNTDIQKAFLKIEKLVFELPYSKEKIKALHADCRNIPLNGDLADLVVTSPPYINVFNYHQNYRKSTELLGWDVLSVARSEIGSNRANRGNRYFTVVQYIMDMAACLFELERLIKRNGKCIFVVGHESNVLGCSFYNSEIIKDIASKATAFYLVQEQVRIFKNKFGKSIREDLLFFEKGKANGVDRQNPLKDISTKHLERAKISVSDKNRPLLEAAIQKAKEFSGTPVYKQD